MRRWREITCTALALVLAASLAGCTGTSRSGSDAPGVTLPSAATGPAGADQRLSAELASEKDIAASLRANGVDSPEHWSKVVADNRPYPKDDPTMAKLRQILTAQGADPQTVERITRSLAP